MSELNPFLIAEASLRANIIELSSGKCLVAGQNQFLTLWTRDFCHACRGLFVLGEVELIENHLGRLIRSLRHDGLVARVVDNQIVQVRVAYQTLRKNLPFFPKLIIQEPLRPQYTDEHGSVAIDSNLLCLLVALRLKRLGREDWWRTHESVLLKMWHWYKLDREGLISQSAFSDWQDSAKREGRTFLTNFFYYQVGRQLQELGLIPFDSAAWKQKLQQTFFDSESGLYRSQQGDARVSLEGILQALEDEHFLSASEKQALWKNLKSHPLTQSDHGFLGRCSYPDYPSSEIAWHVKFAGLSGYHGHIAWSWLMGLGLKVARLMQDQEVYAQQLTKIHALLMRDREVVEIYDTQDLWRPWESWLLSAERPFSWGAGYLVEALEHLQKVQFSQVSHI